MSTKQQRGGFAAPSGGRVKDGAGGHAFDAHGSRVGHRSRLAATRVSALRTPHSALPSSPWVSSAPKCKQSMCDARRVPIDLLAQVRRRCKLVIG